MRDPSLPIPALAAYDLAPPVELFPLSGGVNNTVRGVRTGAGEFVWKGYAAHADRAPILYEHRLLGWLAGRGLSFAVPAPVPARDGQTLCRAGRGWQALFPRLPGSRPDYRDPAQVEAVGAALGELHAALAHYPLTAMPGHSAFGDLHIIHPRIPDPCALTPDRLGLPATPPDDALLAWWRGELAALRPFIDGPYRALPRQVIHSDFMLGNVLIHAGRISGVLDFEFALPDARAIDVASGLEHTMRVWENPASPSPFETARAFCRGYARWGRLTAAEVEVLPWLMRLRDAVSAVWWLGRALDAGDARPGLERIADLRAFTRWLGRHAGQLVSLARLEVGAAG